MAHLVEALRYKPKSRGFEGALGFFTDFNPSSHTMALGSIQSLANEYQEHLGGGNDGRCVGLATLPSSCADCL